MRLFIVSDVHLGSAHCRLDDFLHFLDALPAGVDLLLNGDTIEFPRRRPKRDPLPVVARLSAESRRRRVIWVGGNHDSLYRPPDPGLIDFVAAHDIGRRLHIRHGFYFSPLFPFHKAFAFCFRQMHRLRILVGAEPIHVAQYAKRWPLLYNVLLDNMRRQATDYARRNGFAAVACGHTHYPEDITRKGIRLLNTGSWTEKENHYIDVDAESIVLRRFDAENGTH